MKSPEEPDGGGRARPEARPPYHELAPRPPAQGPIDLPGLVPGAGPLELDVGFGRGLSLFERAERAPEARIVGIEVKAKWATRVDRRARRLGLDRVRVQCGDVRDILHRAVPDGCLRRVVVHFPDPWWKKRHTKRRVVTEGFLDEVARLLEPRGELFLQTDVEPRAEAILAMLRAHDDFELASAGGLIDENPYGARSNRERRAEEDGLPVWRILARRVARRG